MTLRPTRDHVRATALVAAAGLLATALLAGCGDDGGDAATPLKAAEPAGSPETTVTPTGTVVEVAPGPQGIVYDPVTDSVAVAVREPDRLLVLDPVTLKVRMSIALPGKSRHLQLATGGGSVLVPSETANTLIEVDLATGDMQSTQVGEHPHNAAAADNGDILVGNEFDGSISVVRDGEVVNTFDDLEQPGGAVADARTMVVVDVGTFTVTSYDLDTTERTARISGGAGPTHATLVGPGKLVVADTRGGAMLVFSDDPLEQIGRLDLGNRPYGLTSDLQTKTAWVTLTGSNEVVGLDMSGTTPVEIARYPTVQQPDTVAVAPGAKTLWIAGTTDGEIQRIDR